MGEVITLRSLAKGKSELVDQLCARLLNQGTGHPAEIRIYHHPPWRLFEYSYLIGNRPQPDQRALFGNSFLML